MPFTSLTSIGAPVLGIGKLKVRVRPQLVEPNPNRLPHAALQPRPRRVRDVIPVHEWMTITDFISVLSGGTGDWTGRRDGIPAVRQPQP